MFDARELGLGFGATFADSLQFLLDDPRTNTDRARAEAVRYLLRMVTMSVIHSVENHDSAYPQLVRWTPPLAPFCAPLPDVTYLAAHVHGDHTYRLFGTRGDCRFLAVGTFGGSVERMGQLQPVDSRFHVNDGRGNLPVGPDGAVELCLSAEPATDSDIRLPTGDAVLVVRFAYYDWDHESSPQLVVERKGATYPPPPETADRILARIELARTFLHEEPRAFARAIDRCYAIDAATLTFPPLSFSSASERHQGFAGQSYGQGHYELAPDEAAILAVRPPESWYWAFHLASQFRESFDIHLRSMSINGHQAVCDADGVFRAVIAHTDPGMPNWLDTGGRPTGLVIGRYIGADAAPTGTITRVPWSRIRDHLPADTPVVSAAERSEQLRRRMHAVHRRNDI